MLEVQQKTGIKNALLQKRIAELTNSNEYQKAMVAELSGKPDAKNEKLEVCGFSDCKFSNRTNN